ncbi:hypothetical protein [Pseudenhygromyxa sp. WMMC2535]|uniref:hypothetical protein n=1 Tax=Pseudenhygromyxa sp. WMMC2535 TaxID=2712867 RepID=UPI0020D019A3|nr:hypothetical protein [Pseudenhygromyxa sp. WMMC2535]
MSTWLPTRRLGFSTTPFGMTSEHTVVADHVETRRRDQGGESTDEVERVENNDIGVDLRFPFHAAALEPMHWI